METYQLLAIAPAIGQERAQLFIGPLNTAMARFQIVTPAQQAHFIAQVLHESRNLSCMVENLNYSAQALRSQWPSHFTEAQAAQYGRTADHPAAPIMIANLAYANRMGNGDVESGDGHRYVGRGPIQLTGRDMYTRCGSFLGIDLAANPELLEKPVAGCLAAGWFWHVGNKLGHSLNALADAGEVDAISRAINGGNAGLAERAQLTRSALQTLNREGVPA
jgi:putative chitinase